jgi:hypothetical protein
VWTWTVAPRHGARRRRQAFGYPIRSLADLPAGRYRVQAMINRYQTFRRSDGHTVKLPPDKWEGPEYARKPGNLYSRPVYVTISKSSVLSVTLDQEVPPVPISRLRKRST